MLSQGHVSAPLYHYTGQVGPQFWDSGSLGEWKWCHNIMFKDNIHHRPLHTSILGIYKVLEPLVCCLKGIWVHPYIITPAKPTPGSPEEWKWCHYIMVEAHIHLKPLHTSIFDMYKRFDQLLCCLKGIWVHPCHYTSQVGPWPKPVCGPCSRVILLDFLMRGSSKWCDSNR